MKLEQKGRFAPPPQLPKHAQAVADAVAGMAHVQARTHWLLGDETVVDGADYYLGDEELGHLHLDGEAHIAMSPSLRKTLVASGLAEPFRWSGAFVVYRIRRAADVAHATALFALSYARRQGASEATLLAQVAALRERAA